MMNFIHSVLKKIPAQTLWNVLFIGGGTLLLICGAISVIRQLNHKSADKPVVQIKVEK